MKNQFSDGPKSNPLQFARDLLQEAYFNFQLKAHLYSESKSQKSLKRGLVIVPGDIRNPVGSRGDDAMLQAIIDGVREKAPDLPLALLTTGSNLPERFTAQNLRVIPNWPHRWQLQNLIEQIDDFDQLAIIGADVMDGYYTSAMSLRRWHLAEAFCARPGRKATIVGFSFNEDVPGPVRRFLARPMNPAIRINLRDPASLRRFSAIAASRAQQVADVAFLLRPVAGPETETPLAWIDRQRAAGLKPCGLNIHPMLSPTRDPAEIETLVLEAADAARILIDRHNVALLLLPHDFRADAHGDVALLQRLSDAIARPEHVLFQSAPLAANQIKKIAGALDLVFTGRMHLAIGALGSGVPVLGITYTDKFDGLFELLGLPKGQLVSSREALTPGTLRKAFIEALADLDGLKKTLDQNLGNVMALARSNFETIF